jgi:hypothetical protein
MAEQNWCSTPVSATTSVCATQQTNSPCPANCESCRFASLAVTTITSQPSSPVSPPPTVTRLSDTTRRCESTCEFHRRESPAHTGCTHLVCMLMSFYRSQAAAAPTPNSQTPPSPILEAQNFNQRFEAAIANSTALIAQAQTQLAAPNLAPAELTAEEQAEAERNSAWDGLYQQREADIVCASASNQASFQDQELAALLNDAEMGNLTVPDCSDLLTWDSNSGFDAKAECIGVSVQKLMAKFGN